MIVAYCRTCLPGKVILGVGKRVADIRAPHDAHPTTEKNGYFPIPYKGWQQVFVEGDEAKTKENIVVQFGSEFV